MAPVPTPEVLQTLRSCIIAEGLEPSALLDLANATTLREVPVGSLLIRQGDPADCMYVVMKGRLEATVARADGSHLILGEIGESEVVGEAALVRGGARRANVRAEEATQVITLSRETYTALAVLHPELTERLTSLMERRDRATDVRRYRPAAPELIALARRTALLAGLDDQEITSLERQLQWVIIDGGGILMEEGEFGDSLYVLISGRLRTSRRRANGSVEVLGEVFPGDVVGEIAILTSTPRMATVEAIRDCELLRLSKACFDRISKTHPSVALHLARTIATRQRHGSDPEPVTLKARTVAVVATRPGIDLSAFCTRLAAGAQQVARVLHVNRERGNALLGPALASLAPDDPRHAGVVERMNALETSDHDLILFEADSEATHWTERCLRQADEILLVAHAADDPTVGESEAALWKGRATRGSPRIHLVLLHESHVERPRGTRAWLRARTVSAHHHLRVDRSGDYARLGRLLTGRATALVFSGGGARGFAHIGVLQAIDELGLPIDMVGGTSMGALIGAQFALGWFGDEMLRRNRKFWVDDRPLSDYTLPILSLLSGRKVTALCRAMFGDTRIEDLWLRYFCMTSNLTRATADAHIEGGLARWVLASLSLPGIGPPLFDQGDVHVDGGVLNNLPGDEMRKLFEGRIIAVDCGQQHLLSAPLDVPEPPSSWRLLVDRFRRDDTARRIPRIREILLRCSMLAADRLAEKVRAEVALCLQPQMQRFGTLQFESIEEIVRIGHDDAAVRLREWMVKR